MRKQKERQWKQMEEIEGRGRKERKKLGGDEVGGGKMD